MAIWRMDCDDLPAVSPRMHSMHSVSSSGTFESRLRDTLNDEDKFEAFINWMYREFSSEAILSFIEFVQFRAYLMNHISTTNTVKTTNMMKTSDTMKAFKTTGASDSKRFDYQFYSKMPQSSIVHNIVYQSGAPSTDSIIVYDRDISIRTERPTANSVGGAATGKSGSVVFEHSLTTNDNNEGNKEGGLALVQTRMIAHLLFVKYIDHFSMFEINISGHERDKFIELDRTHYAGISIKDMMDLFDVLIGNMLQYIRESHLRFECALQQAHSPETPKSLSPSTSL